jgi:hypothetical protein
MLSNFLFCVNPLFVESLFGNLNIQTQVVELLISLFSNLISLDFFSCIRSVTDFA